MTRICRGKIRKAKAQLEINLVIFVKDDKKCFCKYISNERNAKEDLYPSLYVLGKGEVLNDFFASLSTIQSG